MKKGIAIALLLCLVVSAFTIASAASVKLAVRGGSICLRTGPGLNYSVIAYLKDGAKITVLSTGNAWSKVRNAAGKEGYIKNLYISGIGSKYADGTTYYKRMDKATITTSTVMRAGASSSTGALDTLKKNSVVTVMGANGSWRLIQTAAGNQGFVSASSLSIKGNSSSSGSSTGSGKTAVVTATGLYMREGPGMSYSIITKLKYGTKVQLINTSGNWWLVSYGKYTGYMYYSYLKKK
ncbi:MAG: SH3 domain-containing protein [Clostridia bacterium]|nr:SH3 domain-containing protein [Clostridia bacterium]